MKTESKKEYALGLINDLVANLLYYDRKNDKECSSEDISLLLKLGELTVQEMIDKFKGSIEDSYPEGFLPKGK